MNIPRLKGEEEEEEEEEEFSMVYHWSLLKNNLIEPKYILDSVLE